MEVDARATPQFQETSFGWFVSYLNRQQDILEKTRGNLVVAATVIGAMSFELMINPPGGVLQSDNTSSGDVSCSKAGTSVIGCDPSRHTIYTNMIKASIVSFCASMALILLTVGGLGFRNRIIMAIMQLLMMAAVLCISAAYLFAMMLIHTGQLFLLQMIYMGFWFTLTVVIIMIQLSRILCASRRRSTRQLLQDAP